jgi:CPA1 family monovalent cation:H+ antiporter
MEQFLATETLIIELLLVVSLVALAVRRLRIPYTVALVVVGLLITFQQTIEIDLTPELILSIFIPPLVFEAAFHLEFKSLRANWLPIVGLAIPGVLVTTFIVGAVVSWGVGIPLSSGLVFGALIAATDPVAVVSLFKALGAPKRLTTLVESESLFHDGTAIVLFKLLLVAAAASAVGGGSGASSEGYGTLEVVTATFDFVRVSAGGLLVGVGLGWVIAQVIARVDDYLIETMLTTVLAFGTYLVAERLHVSGVLAVVAAGIITGNIGLKGMSPTTRIVLFNFWEFLAFVANSLVFLLIGLDVNLREIVSNIVPILIALAAVIVSRALVVYGLTALTNLRSGSKVPAAFKHVLFWGGLRGAISLALALSLPLALAERDLLRVMTFGVVLFTLLAQGTTMQFLLRRLGLGVAPDLELEYERRHGRLLAAQAALHRVEDLYRDNVFSLTLWKRFQPELQKEVDDALTQHAELLAEHPELHLEERDDARREGLNAQRAALTTMLSSGLISDAVYDELVTETDRKLEAVDAYRDNVDRESGPERKETL